MNYTQVQNFNMVLQTGYDLAGWESTFVEAGISAISTKIYAQTFSREEITKDSFHMLDHTMPKELGIKTMGDVLTILKLTKEPLVSPASHMKPPTVKIPQLISEMTTQQFWKFRIDWDIFTRITNLPIPIGTTGTTKYNIVDGYHSINPRWGITTTHNLHHGVGSFHVPQNAPRILSIWWCLHT